MSYKELQEFHNKYIAGRPLVIFVSGNAKQFDLKDLSRYGKVQEVKYKQMVKF